MPTDKIPDTLPSSAADTGTSPAGTSTAEAIRNILRGKANSETARRGDNLYGGAQKPPKPPYGTRRSMGKR